LIRDVVGYISRTTVTIPIKRAAYVIFRNESAAGQKGINNNYIGLQADGGRQADKWTLLFAGTCVHAENYDRAATSIHMLQGLGNVRRYLG
jgi:hypothetical protein